MDESIKNAEAFVCKVLNTPDLETDKETGRFFQKAMPHELLPSSNDAVNHHIKRAGYQAFVWLEVITSNPTLFSKQHFGGHFPM